MRKLFKTPACKSPSFLPAVLSLFVSFCALAAHAQACPNINPNQQQTFSISPSYWAPGQSYNVVVTGPSGAFYQSSPGVTSVYIFDPAQYTPGGPVYLEDPNVTHGLATYIDSQHASFSVSVAAGAPKQGDGLNFTCFQTGIVQPPGFIQITPLRHAGCSRPAHPSLDSAGHLGCRPANLYHDRRVRLYPKRQYQRLRCHVSGDNCRSGKCEHSQHERC
jgi:hypothetical protein